MKKLNKTIIKTITYISNSINNSLNYFSELLYVAGNKIF